MSKNRQLRCLAVRQPFAWAICSGAKDIENRSWTTDYRGDIIVVASGSPSNIKNVQKAAKPNNLNADHFALGAVIGIATLADVVPLNPELEHNPWASGPYCWKLKNGRLFETAIPCKGKLKLYAPDNDLADKIAEQLPTAYSVTEDANDRAWINALTHPTEELKLGDYIFSYYDLGDWENVLRHTPRALEVDPDNPEMYAIHGEAFAKTERYKDALGVFTEMVKRFPDLPNSYALRALAYEDLGDEESAGRDIAKVLALDPHFYDDDGSEDAEEERG